MRRNTALLAVLATIVATAVFYALLAPIAFRNAYAAQLAAAFSLTNGDQVTCQNGQRIDVDFRQQHRLAVIFCAQPPATSTSVPPATATPLPTLTPIPTLTNTPVAPATNTPVAPPTNTPPPVAEDPLYYCHAPGAHLGADGNMLNIHEHGDCPPIWVTQFMDANFGSHALFGQMWASSPMENTHKHQGYKGYNFNPPPSNVNGLYIMAHAFENPMERMTANGLHSYIAFVLDKANNVSVVMGVDFYGWQDVGPCRLTRLQEQPNFPGLTYNGGAWPGRCQFSIATPGQAGNDPPYSQWYGYGSNNFGFSLGITIGGSPTRRPEQPGPEPCGDMPANLNCWLLTGGLGLDRTIEASWYLGQNPNIRENHTPVGAWYCVKLIPDMPPTHTNTNTPIWVIAPGTVPDAHSCAAGYAPNLTRETMDPRGIWFQAGNKYSKVFPGPGVTMPN